MLLVKIASSLAYIKTLNWLDSVDDIVTESSQKMHGQSLLVSVAATVAS